VVSKQHTLNPWPGRALMHSAGQKTVDPRLTQEQHYPSSDGLRRWQDRVRLGRPCCSGRIW
jgi:hypothetical protein